MAQPSGASSSFPGAVSVIGPQYIAPYPIDLGIVKKVMTISDGNFVITDSAGNIMFKVKGVFLTFIHQRRHLLDSSGVPVITLQSKAMTAHYRWQAFRGESTDPSDLIFSAKTSSILFLKTKLHIFLAHNTKEDACDYRVEGSYFERSCKIYIGESSTVIAEMHKKHTAGSILLGKDNYMVTVYPNIDYLFIIALIVILDEINHTGQQS